MFIWSTDWVGTLPYFEKCGGQGFVHVFGGAWASANLQKAVRNECFGKGNNRHAVFTDGRGFMQKNIAISTSARNFDCTDKIDWLTNKQSERETTTGYQ